MDLLRNYYKGVSCAFRVLVRGGGPQVPESGSDHHTTWSAGAFSRKSSLWDHLTPPPSGPWNPMDFKRSGEGRGGGDANCKSMVLARDLWDPLTPPLIALGIPIRFPAVVAGQTADSR